MNAHEFGLQSTMTSNSHIRNVQVIGYTELGREDAENTKN